MINQEEYDAALKERLEQNRVRLVQAERDLKASEWAYTYWEKVTKALKVLIAHEEWLEAEEKKLAVAGNR